MTTTGINTWIGVPEANSGSAATAAPADEFKKALGRAQAPPGDPPPDGATLREGEGEAIPTGPNAQGTEQDSDATETTDATAVTVNATPISTVAMVAMVVATPQFVAAQPTTGTTSVNPGQPESSPIAGISTIASAVPSPILESNAATPTQPDAAKPGVAQQAMPNEGSPKAQSAVPTKIDFSTQLQAQEQSLTTATNSPAEPMPKVETVATTVTPDPVSKSAHASPTSPNDTLPNPETPVATTVVGVNGNSQASGAPSTSSIEVNGNAKVRSGKSAEIEKAESEGKSETQVAAPNVDPKVKTSAGAAAETFAVVEEVASEPAGSDADLKDDSRGDQGNPAQAMPVAAPKRATTIGPTGDVEAPAKLSDTKAKAVVRQLVDRLEFLAAARAPKEVVIRLEPRELGSLLVSIRQSGGEVETHIQATEPSVRAALLDNRPNLDRALLNKGLSLGNVTVGQESSTHAQSQGHRQHAPGGNARPNSTLPGNDDQVDVTAIRQAKRQGKDVDLWI